MKHSVREVKLKNGARGLLIHVPDATVMTFDLNFRAGDYLCTPDKWETAHLMEHLVLGANKQYRSAQNFSQIFEQNGAYSNAATGSYNINYEVECADFEWDRILELLILSVSSPLFLEKEFDAQFGNVKEELIQRSNNYAAVLGLELKKYCGFVGYTYEDGIKSMKNITLDDVRAHHARTHFTKNMRFIIAGNVNDRSADIIASLEKLDMPSGDTERIELPDEKTHGLLKPLYLPYKSVPNIYFSLDTFSSELLTQPERDCVNALDDILNGSYASRIFGKARDRGLVYDVGSSPYSTKLSSGWGIDGQVSRDNAPKLF